VSRFLREARIAAAVQHRNVVHIVDFGSTDEGRPFMVMEHLRGETLADRLARAPAPTVDEMLDIVALTLAGLAAAHDAGVVHRDMKPENVFLVEDADGAYPKILDFGISRSLQPESGPRSALTTREGFLVGTPQYMSPEQARGLEGIDHRTDLYSVGVILYEALTGRLPADSDHIGDLIILIAAGGAPMVSEVRAELGEALSEVVRKALSVDRDARYPDARAMRAALLEAKERTPDEALALPARSRRRKSGLPAPPPDTNVRTVGERGAKSAPETASALAKTLPVRKADDGGVAPPAQSVETPRAWTVSEREASRSGARRGLFVGALAAAAIGAVAWWGARGGGDGAHDTREPSFAAGSEGADVLEPPPTETEPDPAIVPATVAVALDGLPEEATVTVDGEPAPGNPVELQRNGQIRVIEVTAEGMQPWRVEHVADADATYAVDLHPIPTEIAQRPRPAAQKRPPRRRPAAPPEASMAQGMQSPPATLRDLDY
jgi:serine/threonine-protein kinase